MIDPAGDRNAIRVNRSRRESYQIKEENRARCEYRDSDGSKTNHIEE
jgi:hypothetical protein